MTNINSIATGLIESSLLKKIQKKENKINKTKFNKAAHIDKTDHNNDLDLVSSVNPFLFLQEVDEYKNDQEKLKENGNKILKALNDIRLGLLHNQLNDHMLHNLRNNLTQNIHKFKFLELQGVIDDIVLRCEIEIAKIEKNRKN